MDQQEDITHFQETLNGPFPFSANGIVVALPSASFEEEMQTKIVFVGGTIGGNQGTNINTFAHENMHQWWGDNVAYAEHRLTFFKEGYATTAEYYTTARAAAIAAGGLGTPAGDAAYETSIRNRFNTQLSDDLEHVLGRRAVEPDVGEPVQHREHLHATGHVLPRAAGDPRPEQLQRREQGDPADLRRRLGHRAAADRRLPQVPEQGQLERGVLRQARRLLQAVVGHGLHGLAGTRQSPADHGPRPGRPALLRRGGQLRGLRRRAGRRCGSGRR